MISRYGLLLIFSILAGCEQRSGLAPVVESTWQPQTTHATRHIVKRGETLYAVAFRYDKDFRQLAAYNHLRSPYNLRVGQVIRLYHSATVQHYPKQIAHRQIYRPQRPIMTANRQPQRSYNPVARHYGTWQWPAYGRIAAGFAPQQGKKGIDIAGKKGEAVRAAANGVVAYAGNGLAGYGNLIIIKHDGQFLTAYGNNSRNRVTEGQRVKAGQVIADMGMIDRSFWGVHFEIRRSGQPVNPMNYLQKG